MLLVWFAIAATAFTAGSFVTQRPVTCSLFHPPVAAGAPALAVDEQLDALGNEISSAVAEYSFDDDGELYERHSPKTELPRLGSPKS